MAAWVVDLPQPAGPVTSTRPRGRSAKYLHTGGRLSSSMVEMRSGIERKTEPTLPRWTKALTRKRPTPSMS